MRFEIQLEDYTYFVELDKDLDVSLGMRELEIINTIRGSKYTKKNLFHTQEGKHALLYSTGFDSTACLYLNPKIEYCFYIQRDGVSSGSLLNQEKALYSFEKMQALFPHINFIKVKTNIESMRRDIYKKHIGYMGDFGMAIPIIPLLEGLGITHLNFGMILEVAYMSGGLHFSDFKSKGTYLNTVESLNNLGLGIVLPTACTPNHVNRKICRLEGVDPFTSSCIRGTIEKPCGSCRKCFRMGLNLDKPVGFFGSELSIISKPALYNIQPCVEYGYFHKFYGKIAEEPELDWYSNFFYKKAWVCENKETDEMIKKNAESYLGSMSDIQTFNFENYNFNRFKK